MHGGNVSIVYQTTGAKRRGATKRRQRVGVYEEKINEQTTATRGSLIRIAKRTNIGHEEFAKKRKTNKLEGGCAEAEAGTDSGREV